MRTWLISSSVLLLVILTFHGMDSTYDFDSGEQDRWPTLEELGLSKRLLSRKREDENFGGSEGRMAYGKRPTIANGPEEDKEHTVSSLYDLLSSQARPAPQKRIMDNLKDIYAAELVKRHRLPRSPEDTIVNAEPEGEQISEQVVQETSSNGQMTE
ncbi:hypothetical protein GDO78_013064 [Eleutherodactylus coqui]|uniref:Uncharacterized protein n=1 Tax=Eleutherodactylus coqui TaxID=57060 RepID=A0A8J6EXI1_ELECQ|nr:hypothetical protein GDO78_013064 [Eleutherodactylus coqui]KAG9477879.1 hypothetical protein GDO78_013064 [Eleutherodactylus coqui]